MASCGTNKVSYGFNTVSCGSSGEKGLPALCSVLPAVSSVGVLCCIATRTVLCLLSHTLLYCNQDCSLCIVSYFAVLQPGLFSVYCLILCCIATRTVLSVLSHTLLYCNQDCSQCIVSYTVQPLGPSSVNYLRHLLICHCLQCNQSCHQFVAKHTLMSFITGLGYFVSWGSYNNQTYFFLLVLSSVSC